jgi:hypothetical protein
MSLYAFVTYVLDTYTPGSRSFESVRSLRKNPLAIKLAPQSSAQTEIAHFPDFSFPLSPASRGHFFHAEIHGKGENPL